MLLAGFSFSATSCVFVSPVPTPSISAQAEPSKATTAIADASNSKQQPKRKGVADYFLAIPEPYFQPIRITQAERQSLLAQAKQGQRGAVYDPNNGYIELKPISDLCSTYTIAIFSRLSASPLVALNVSCTVSDQVSILDPDQNWKDVTASVLPADLSVNPELDSFVEVKLPRIGRTIEVRRETQNQPSVSRYRFNGDRFVRE